MTICFNFTRGILRYSLAKSRTKSLVRMRLPIKISIGVEFVRRASSSALFHVISSTRCEFKMSSFSFSCAMTIAGVELDTVTLQYNAIGLSKVYVCGEAEG